MNVSLTNPQGLPPKAYISLRVGDTRRLTSWSKSNTFTFPSGPSRSIHVDLFEKLGSAQVSLAALADGGPSRTHVDIPSSGGSVGLDVTVEPAAAGEAGRSPKAERKEAVKSAMSYMESSGAQQLLAKVVQQLMLKQPQDPAAFILDFVAAQRAEAPQPTPTVVAIPSVPSQQRASRMPDLTGHFSLLAEALRQSPHLYDELSGKTTTMGVSFADVIRPGIENKGHRMIRTAGLVAGDAECFSTFQAVFDAVLGLRGDAAEPAPAARPSPALLSSVSTEAIDPTGGHVVSVQARASRNLRRFRFPPACAFDERREVERLLTKALLELTGYFEGSYLPLAGSNSYAPRPGGMTVSEELELEGRKAAFFEPDSAIALSSGVGRDWPDGRGVFVGRAAQCWAWINEEDHLRLFASEASSDLRAAYGRLLRLEASLAELLRLEDHDFAYDERLGFLTSGPANVGTGLCVSVHARLPLLSGRPDFRGSCRRLQLHASQLDADVWALSSQQRLGASPVEQVNAVIRGCRELVAMEVALEQQQGEGSRRPSGGGEAPLEEDGEDAYPEFPVEPCPEALPDLSRHCSLAAELLRREPELYPRLRTRATARGVPFAKVIKPAVVVKGHAMIRSIGAFAGDEESYDTFSDFFDRLIGMVHPGFNAGMPSGADGAAAAGLTLQPLDASGDCVVGLRLDASRNLRGLRFGPACSGEERRAAERLCARALEALPEAAGGRYYPVEGSPSWDMAAAANAVQADWLGDVLPAMPSAGLQAAAGLARGWPDARGAFATSDLALAAAVNDEDHLLLSVRSTDADLPALLARFRALHDAAGAALEQQGSGFARCPRLGYLTVCPSKLGAALRLVVRVRLPLLTARGNFRPLCRTLQLEALQCLTGAAGEWDISARSSLGMSEATLVTTVSDRVRCLVELEHALRDGGVAVSPGLGSEPFPGLLPQRCPAAPPSLAGHRCLGARVFCDQPALYDSLKDKETPNGVSLGVVIKGAVDVFGGGDGEGPAIGLAAGDADSYDLFAPIFGPALCAFHGSLPTVATAPALNASLVKDWPASGQPRLVSVRLRLFRSLSGLRFAPACSVEERREVERLLVGALVNMEGCGGEYLPLAGSWSFPARPGGMTAEDEEKLRSASALFGEPKAALRLAMGFGRHWPDARGVYACRGQDAAAGQGSLHAFVNEEEHLALVATEHADVSGGADAGSLMRAAVEKLARAESQLDAALSRQGHGFARHPRWGAATALPERLGAALAVAVKLRLPTVAAAPDLAQRCAAAGLQLLGRGAGGVVEVGNRATLGVSEVELVNGVVSACARLIQEDQA